MLTKEIGVNVDTWKFDTAINKMMKQLAEDGGFFIELDRSFARGIENNEDMSRSFSFKLNKRRYRIRMEDETEDSVRIIIEPLAIKAPLEIES